MTIKNKKLISLRTAAFGFAGIILILSFLAVLSGSMQSTTLGLIAGLGFLLLAGGLIFGRQKKGGEE